MKTSIKLFLLIGVLAIAVSCTKEEQPEPKNTQDVLSEFVLKKQNVDVNGVICDMYEHPVSKQIVYRTTEMEVNTSKAVTFSKRPTLNKDGVTISCPDNGTTCAVTEIGGVPVCIVMQNK